MVAPQEKKRSGRSPVLGIAIKRLSMGAVPVLADPISAKLEPKGKSRVD